MATMTLQGRFLLVELEEGLEPHRVIGIFAGIKQIPGTRLVVDLAVVSQDTLDVILLPEAATIPAKTTRKRRAATA